eukprot:GEZU01024466.1.p1 GENE.GEZU01024466.1~~GEZU01024466.1.p1  ORF type:complete len:172 (+),score=60.81 GEZU01024466.1:237-752(+)
MSLNNFNNRFFDSDFGFFMDPWKEMRRLEREMNRMLGSWGSATAGNELMVAPYSSSLTTTFTPRCDVSETDKNIVVSCELPGIPKDNINIDLENDVLTISGEKKEEKKEENERLLRVERSFGKFSRRIALPKNVDPNSIQASFENGVLNVVVPKPANTIGESRKQIPIKDK